MNPPITIERPKPYLLKIVWQDKSEHIIQLEKMREECPCAACQGEEIMGQRISFGIKTFLPGMNELEALIPVGNYGIQANWKDGHHTGIYTWEKLHQLSEKYTLSFSDFEQLSQMEDNKQ